MSRIVIIGAGISGLSLAYRLERLLPDADVTVLERDARPGGKVWTECHEGFVIEIGPNGFLDTKPATANLCTDLGIGDRLIPASDTASRNRFLFLNGKLRGLPSSALAFLRSDVLSWRGKLALFTERFRRSFPASRDESVEDFAVRRVGREITDVLVDAFVTGIHAGDLKLLSARAAFPRLVALEEQYGSVLKGMAATAKQRRREGVARPGRLWSFTAGLRVLIESVSAKLRRTPLLGVCVCRIERTATGWMIYGEGQDRWEADAVVLTCPAPQQATILAELDSELAELIAAIPYNRIAVVALGYRRADVPLSLDGFGYLTPRGSQRDVLGVQWCSSTYPGRAPAGTVLLSALCGGWQRPDIVGWDDTRLIQAVTAELRLSLGIAAPPIFHRIIRWEQAIPQYHVGHLNRVAAIEARAARHPGLFLAGNAYRGIALNDCTEQAEILVPRLAAALGAAQGPSRRPEGGG
jgi:oxygen-dependent protoporphyrinogen oxidase